MGGGVALADERCNEAATEAGLGSRWKAYMRDPDLEGGPELRIEGDGPWVDLTEPNPQQIFANFITIYTTGPSFDLVVDENGDRILDMSFVWTGDPLNTSNENFCASWTNATQAGWVGVVGGPGDAWTHHMNVPWPDIFIFGGDQEVFAASSDRQHGDAVFVPRPREPSLLQGLFDNLVRWP